MSDVLSPEQRKFCMSRISGRNTQPELALRKGLWVIGYRYRLRTQLPGNPDIVFPKKKVAVFVDGCFWHKCPKHFVIPKTRTNFWMDKINKNCERDKRVTKELKQSGWKVLRIWEHEIKENLSACVERVEALLSQ
ncbi:T/G mismatch-specific endonuclease [Microbulbifer thermotolerans]|uniref:very short patch repair endonuclease n=1 Tax=Microbulbifer thermotolerans TaxID=252514 RepID=UPI0008E271CD|nr:very short patch repair endonuclease [Microbulbifer thermotolerans]SFC18724.1 T/G mismatch-specific endonuclease [Microbulbifer thermotolerans]